MNRLQNSNFIAVAGCLLILAGCGGSSDIAGVKDGFLDGYDALTVGKALDGWSACASTTWESFETDRGEKIVEYRCAMKGVAVAQQQALSALEENLERVGEEAFVQRVTGFQKGRALGLAMQGDRTLAEKMDQGARFSANAYRQLWDYTSHDFVMQFSLSQRDDSFEISYFGHELVYADGSSLPAGDINVDVDTMLAAIYNDDEPGLSNWIIVDAAITPEAVVP